MPQEPYKLPRAIQFVEDLPKTSTGKVMRRMLRTLESEETVPTQWLRARAASRLRTP
jgi:acyl-coenzyme A synthetase/AMP-(fatty) acid ligase